MDFTSLLGLALGFGAIIGGNFIEGGHIASLAQFAALFIVLGGTMGAIILQTPWEVLKRSINTLPLVFVRPQYNTEALVKLLVNWSTLARQDGYLSLEKRAASDTKEPFLQKGIGLLVDGFDAKEIKSILEAEAHIDEERDLAAAKVFEAMGGYSPTIGIIGAVLGLIHVMGSLTDPESLGNGIAVAFVATIYGVGFANLFFFPVANKLKGIAISKVHYRYISVDGLCAIADGKHPTYIERILEGHL